MTTESATLELEAIIVFLVTFFTGIAGIEYQKRRIWQLIIKLFGKKGENVGDPLKYPFFREKKVGGKRVYFLIYSDIRAVLMVGISDKKEQQETIDDIKGRLEEYHEVIKEAIRQHGEYGHA